jgi:hypothetical protein
VTPLRIGIVGAGFAADLHALNLRPLRSLKAEVTADGAVGGDEYITEKVETKAGWQFPSSEEDWMRGYPQELEVIYAGYLSAATGRRAELAPS